MNVNRIEYLLQYLRELSSVYCVDTIIVKEEIKRCIKEIEKELDIK